MAARIVKSNSISAKTSPGRYAAAMKEMKEWSRTLEEFARQRRIQGIDFSWLLPFFDVETTEMISGAGMLEGSAIAAQDNAVGSTPIGDGEDARGKEIDEGLRDRVFVFKTSGNMICIAGFGERGHFNRLKGHRQIAALIRAAPNPVSMLELDMTTPDERITCDVRSRQPMADSEALNAYRKRLAELESELARARANNDSANTDRLEIEKAKLIDHVMSVVGIRGEVRDLNSRVEKLRPKIWGTINTAINAMREAVPLVAAHFEENICSEGASFVYRVLNNAAPTWDLG